MVSNSAAGFQVVDPPRARRTYFIMGKMWSKPAIAGRCDVVMSQDISDSSVSGHL